MSHAGDCAYMQYRDFLAAVLDVLATDNCAVNMSSADETRTLFWYYAKLAALNSFYQHLQV